MIKNRDDKNIEIQGITFIFVQELTPERNTKGEIGQFMPQDRYEKSSISKLNPHGGGPFCKFSIGSKWSGRSGVYALLSSDDLLYIGECADLRSRYNMGYGNISPKNCYQGGQPTNCKINSMVLNQYLCGNRVFLYFHETDDYKRLEASLLNSLAPPYNGTGVRGASSSLEKTFKNRATDGHYINKVDIHNNAHLTKPTPSAQSSKSSNADSITGHLANSGKKVCDDCLSDELLIHPRQQVNQICNRLAKKGSIKREGDMCDVCKKDKLVNSIA